MSANTPQERDQITARNRTESPFLRLPAELRNAIYRLALDTATVLVAFPRPTMHRQDIRLPQVCRQINTESKPFLNTYTIARVHCDGIFRRAGTISVLLASPKFSTVRQLEFSQAMATAVYNEMSTLTMLSLISDQSQYARATAHTFHSLQIIVLPREVKRDTALLVYSVYFDKFGLEVKYNHYNSW